jgi:hypothetical protein
LVNESLPDPFDDLVLDDRFVEAATIKEPRMVDRPGRWARSRRARWIGLVVQTATAFCVASALAVCSCLGIGPGSPRPTGSRPPAPRTPVLGTPAPGTQRGTQLRGRQLPGTQLPGTQLPGTQLPGTQLPGTQLPGTQLPVPEPWHDPSPEVDVQVEPDWLAVGPPMG